MLKVGDLVQIRCHTEEKEKSTFWWHPLQSAMEGNIYPISEVTPNGWNNFKGW